MKRYAADRQVQLLQQILRMVFLFGCATKGELRSLMDLNVNTADKEFSALLRLFSLDGSARAKLSVSGNWMEAEPVRMLDVYLGQDPIRRDYSFWARYVHIAAYLAGHGSAGFTELRTESAAMDHTQAAALRKFLKRLEDLGLIKCHADKKGNVYSLTDPFWNALTADELRQVQWFVEWAALARFPSYDGRTLLDKLRVLTGDEQRLFFSDASPHALLDEDILYQIEPFIGNRWVTLELLVRDKEDPFRLENIVASKTVCVFPCAVLHEQECGRSWLIGVRREEDGRPGALCQLPVSTLMRCRPADCADEPENWRERTQRALRYTFSSSCLGEQHEPVTVTVRFTPQVLERVCREGVTEGRSGVLEEDAGGGLYRLTVASASEILPWLRTFGSSACLAEVRDAVSGTDRTAEFREKMESDWKELIRRYES